MYIYCITNKVTGKQYVGQCVHSVDDSSNYYGSGIYIKSSLKTYGKDNFIKEILEELEEPNKAHLNEREMFWIKEKNTKFPNGYNLTDGGEGCRGLTEESIEKIREKNKLLVGEKNSRYGKKNSVEHNRILREVNLGRVQTEETKEKIRKAKLGTRRSKESIEKWKDTVKKNGGITYSDDRNKRCKENQPYALKVSQYLKDGTFVQSYISAMEACRQTGINNTSIANCCKGRSKTAGKFIWKFSE